MSGHGALAGVMTGWTGNVEIDRNVTTVVVPAARESVASFCARIVAEVYSSEGVALLVSVGTSGVITITDPTEQGIQLNFSGNCADRTGFTGTYSSAASQTADDPYEQGWIADRGMRQDAPLWSTSGERGAVGDGSGATAPTRAPARSRYVAWDTASHLPDLSREYDYWHDGRLFGRFIVESARLVPLGVTRTADNVTVEIDIAEVS